jgi:hypothetical protein
MTPLNISIASYNLLHPYLARVHEEEMPEAHRDFLASPWTSRREALAKNIRSSQADLVCVQECGSLMWWDLKRMLSPELAPAVHGLHRFVDGVGIFYNPEKFTLLNTKIIPHLATRRITVFADLQEKTTKAIVRVASAHILGKAARSRGNSQLEEALTHLTDGSDLVDFFLIAGDFNENLSVLKPGARAASLKRRDFRLCLSPHETEVEKQRRKFDGIAARVSQHSKWALREFSSADTSHPDRYPVASDHRLVTGTFSICPEPQKPDTRFATLVERVQQTPEEIVHYKDSRNLKRHIRLFASILNAFRAYPRINPLILPDLEKLTLAESS